MIPDYIWKNIKSASGCTTGTYRELQGHWGSFREFLCLRDAVCPTPLLRDALQGRYRGLQGHQGHQGLQGEICKLFLMMGDSVDKYLDKLGRLQMILGLNDAAIDMKLRETMSEKLRQRWSMVPIKPRSMSDRLRQLRDIGHDIEDNRNYERSLKRSKSGPSNPHSHDKKNSKPQKEFKIKGKAKEKSGRKGRDDSEFKDKKVELKGISQDILDQRRKDDKCLKCGKGGHEWYKCWTKEPVTAKVAGTKRKGGDLASRVSEPKKARVASGEAEAAPSAASGRIMEVPSDEEWDTDRLWEMIE